MARIAPNVGPFRMKGLDIFVETVNYASSSESDDVPDATQAEKCSLYRFRITCRRDLPVRARVFARAKLQPRGTVFTNFDSSVS